MEAEENYFANRSRDILWSPLLDENNLKKKIISLEDNGRMEEQNLNSIFEDGELKRRKKKKAKQEYREEFVV